MPTSLPPGLRTGPSQSTAITSPAVAIAPEARPGSEPGLPPPENKRFYPALDGLRAIAVLLVFAEHYLVGNYPALNWGWTGVDIFFVLSGFLITGILYDSRRSPHRLRTFYMRRTLRIFPLYYGVLLVALLTTPLFHWYWNPAWLLWLTYLGNYARFIFRHTPLAALNVVEQLRIQPIHPGSFILRLGHFWSLCVEEQFYLVWPLVVFTLRRRETLRALCLWSIPVILAARIAAVFLLPRTLLYWEPLYRLTPFRVDALLIGGALALALRGPEADRLLRLARPALFSFVAAFLLWELSCRLLQGSFYHPGAGDRLISTLGYTLIDLASAVLILNLLSLDHPLARLLNLRPLRYLGKISYGLYVFHDMFHDAYILAAKKLFPHHLGATHPFLVAAIALPCTLLLASLSFRFFESPFLRLKARYTT